MVFLPAFGGTIAPTTIISYIFKYSSRPDTEAAKFIDVAKPGELEKRHKKILDLQRSISKGLSKHAEEK